MDEQEKELEEILRIVVDIIAIKDLTEGFMHSFEKRFHIPSVIRILKYFEFIKADLREYVFIQLSYELMVFLLISFGVDFIGTQNPKTVFSVNEGERSAVVPLHHDRSDIINSNNGSSTAVRDRLRIAAHVIQFDTHTGLIGFSQPFGKRV